MQIEIPEIHGSGELWLEIMRVICGDTPNHPASNMCDLMCHRAPYTPLLGFKERTYVDIQNREFDFPEEKGYFTHMDVFEFMKVCGVDYDLMICSDGIEHLTKEQGEELLWWMDIHSDKQVIFTPLGEYMLTEDKHPDSHRSGWTPELLPDYLSIVFPDFHPTLGVGAFFAVNCSGIEKERILHEIKNKYEQSRIS